MSSSLASARSAGSSKGSKGSKSERTETTSLQDRFPILTGGSEDAEEIEDCSRRVGFFAASAVCMTVVGFAGALISRLTNSDMVLVDFWDMVADIFGLTLSVAIEKYKQHCILSSDSPLTSRKNVLLIDACGGTVSFVLLLVVVIAGAFLVEDKIEDPTDIDNRIHKRKFVLGYAILSMLGDIVPLTIYRDTLGVLASADANKLNILSGMLHIGIDLLRATVTFAISLWMIFAGRGALGIEYADSLGTMVICALVLASAVYVANEAVTSFREVLLIDEEMDRTKA